MTPFARKVYKAVMKIPLGQVRSYKWVAGQAGKPKAARAVGQVLKHNPYPLLIPCHRVVGGNNKLGGYVFGLKNKKLLLDLENELSKSL
jgi:methylated-DNA-[protein]-cysteine S-methyltransferase